ncbi:unnamed protein product [Paramecium primaurelia]|uniref:Uncharacterized protein n=1 Tax=Paramecium primaurelia TaxID=5886 RepID=A0A8S1PVN1_PARPR|nr:unnamed protein product [Paramecium primaurelia]
MDQEIRNIFYPCTDFLSNSLVHAEIQEQSFDHNHFQYTNQNHTQEQHSQRMSQNSTQKMVYKEKDLKYKNFPKLIGNNFLKWIKKLINDEKIKVVPKGIDNLMKSRQKCKQPNFTIKDLQELCSDEASQKLFQEYIQDELFLDIFHSNKIADPFSYIPGISNYFACSQEPQKMKSNYLTRKQFTHISEQTE